MTDEALLRNESSTNREFLSQHNQPGTILIVGGSSAIDRGIRMATSLVTADQRPSRWSHACVVTGERVDGQTWVVESDLDVRSGTLRFGVQENRISKYTDEVLYPNLLAIQLPLTPSELQRLQTDALDLVSNGVRYALGGIVQTATAMVRGRLWRERNKRSAFCSSLVRTLFNPLGYDLAPDIAVRHTTPEHLAQCSLPHERWQLVRQA